MAATYLLVMTFMTVIFHVMGSTISCGQDNYLTSAIVQFTLHHNFPQVVLLYTGEYSCTAKLLQAHPKWITKTSIWEIETLNERDIQQIPDIYSAKYLIIILASTNNGYQVITKTRKEVPYSSECTWLILYTESWNNWNFISDPRHNTIYLGIVGNASLPEHNIRYDFMIHSRTSFSLERIGKWRLRSGFVLMSEPYWNFKGFNNRTFHVVTTDFAIFHYKQNNGNETVWKGICIDMLNTLAEYLQFQYYLSEPPDGNWGAKEANGSWNGMVGQVLQKEVDFALGKFTVTQARDTVIDYTYPYWHEPLQMVMKKPQKNTLLLYLRPFKWQIWVALFASCILMSGMLAFIWFHEQRIVILRHPNSTNDFKHILSNACGTIIRSLIFQGTAHLPSQPGARIVIGTWLFFSLVIVATYSGNLVASLAVPKITLPVQTLEDLANSDFVSGSLGGSALSALFEDSSSDVYKTIWDKSMQHGKHMMDSDSAGIERVLSDDKYVFILEASGVQDALANDIKCEMAMAKEDFFPSSFGLVFPENSPLLPIFNGGIVNLVESGLLTKWKDVYFPNVNCTLEVTGGEAQPASSGDVIGIFIVLGAGLFTATLVLCLECQCQLTVEKKCSEVINIL